MRSYGVSILCRNVGLSDNRFTRMEYAVICTGFCMADVGFCWGVDKVPWLAVSINWGVLFVGVLMIGSLLSFEIYVSKGPFFQDS